MSAALPVPKDTSEALYRWCLVAYPPGYRVEHGSELLATVRDGRDGKRPVSVREMAGLIAGGVRRRSMEACAEGPVQGMRSALRGTAAALLLLNAIVLVVGLGHLHRGWVTLVPAHLRGGVVIPPGFLLGTRHELGAVAVAPVTAGPWQWSAIVLGIVAVLVLTRGSGRLAGGVLLASCLCTAAASNWLTVIGIHNRLGWWAAWGGVPFVSAYTGDNTYTSRLVDPSLAATVLVPAVLLFALPRRDRATGPGWSPVLGWLTGLAVLTLLFLAIPWLWQNPGAALLAAFVLGGVVFGRLDGRIAVAAGALVLIDVGLISRAWQWTRIGGGQGPGIWLGNGDRITIPWIPILTLGAVLLAVWGLSCMRRRTRVVRHLVG